MKIKAAAFNSITNIINLSFNILTGLILVPIYFRYFDLSTYGAWLASGNIIMLLTTMESGLSLVLTQNLSKLFHKEDEKFIGMLNSGIIIYSIISILILITGISVLPYIPDIVKVSPLEKESLMLGITFSLLATVSNLLVIPFQAISQVYQKTSMPGLFNVIGLILATTTVLLCLSFGYSVASIGISYFVRALALLITNFLYSLYLLNSIKHREFYFDWSNIVYLLKEITLPFFSTLSQKIAGNTQNLIIAYFISPTFTAIYDITSKVTLMLRSFLNILSYSTFTGFALTFAEGDENKTSDAISRFLFIYSLVMVFVYSFSYIFTPIIIKYWVGISNFGGYTLLILIILSAIVSDFLSLLNMFIWSVGKYQKGSVFDIVNVTLYLMLMGIFISHFGYIGVPLASFITGLVSLILIQINILTKINLKINTLYKPFMMPFVLGIILSFCLTIAMPEFKDISMLSSFVYLISFIVSLMIMFYLVSRKHIIILFNTLKIIASKSSPI